MFQLLLSSLVDGCWWLGIPYSLLLPEMKIVKTRNRVPAKYTLFNTIYWFIYTSPKIYCSKKNSWGWKDMTVVVMASLNLPSRRKIWRQKSSFPRCLIKEKHDTRSMGKTAYDALERWWRHRMFCFFFPEKNTVNIGRSSGLYETHSWFIMIFHCILYHRIVWILVYCSFFLSEVSASSWRKIEVDILVRHINEQLNNIIYENFKPFILETSTEKYHSKHIILVNFLATENTTSRGKWWFSKGNPPLHGAGVRFTVLGI